MRMLWKRNSRGQTDLSGMCERNKMIILTEIICFAILMVAAQTLR